MPSEQISLSTVIVLAVITGVIYKYVIAAPASTPNSPQARQSREAEAQRSREAVVVAIQQVFPQIDRRTLLWNLRRPGANVQTTTERILAGRLETPPESFQPPPLPRTAPPAPAQQQQQQQQRQPSPAKPAQPDLITRYNLQNQVRTAADDSAAATNAGAATGWSANKDERQALLKKRRDDMILAARRKMEAKLTAEREGAAAGADALD